MKHIIIEGGDRLGKNTILKNLCEHYSYNNITIRHFDKPPKGLNITETLEFQMNTFYKEMLFADHIRQQIDGDEYGYHDNILIWNRSHLGEYVYSQMFRNIVRKNIADKLRKLEKSNLYSNQYLITLTADPKFFLDKEDGLSFSKTLEDKNNELRLFKEVHALSLIKNKKLLKVDNKGEFRPKDEIFKEVLDFINK